MNTKLLSILRKTAAKDSDLLNILQFVLDRNLSAVCYVNSSKRIEYANSKFSERYSRLHSKIIGCHLREIFGLNTYNQLYPVIKESQTRPGNRVEKTINIIDPLNGFESPVNFTAQAKSSGASYVEGFILTFEETTDLDEVEDTQSAQNDDLVIQKYLSEIERSKSILHKQSIELEEARDQAILATRAKSIFLASMSHEIRTPINGVIGMASLLTGTNLTIEQKEYVDAIESSARTLLYIINDVLDYSKIEAGKLSLYMTEVELRKIVKETSVLFRALLQSKSLNFKINIAPNVPHLIRGDDIRIKQVLNNLLSNAIKFTPENGEVELQIDRISGDKENAKLRFSVKDSGVGISEEQQRRIFEAFEQAEISTARSYGGTGLGLSISSKIVNLMGGKLEVVSQLDIGSTFYFDCLFKVIIDQKDEPPINQYSENELENLQKTDYPLNVLIVEDNLVNQRIAYKMLEKLGHKVTLVGDGIEALEIIENKNFDIIFMDCQMPKLDGFDTTLRIRQFEELNDKKRIPVVAMTANALEGDRQKCLAAGMDGYVAKPFRVSDITKAISKITSNPE